MVRHREYLRVVPGLLVLLGLGLLSKYLAGYIPYVNYVILAIFFGALWGNLLPVPGFLWPGLKTYKFWLYLGIVFLGARLVLQNMFKLGGVGLLMIAVEIALSLGIVFLLAPRLGVSDKLATLLATGVSICGVSAIIGCSGAIDADEEDTAYAIATILVFGAAAILIYAVVGQALGMGGLSYGTWAGLAIDNTAEVMAGAEFYDGLLVQNGLATSASAATYAALVKNGRNALMGLVILGLAIHYARRGLAEEVEHKGWFLWENFPKFVLGFILFSLFSTLGVFTPADIASLKHLYKWAFMLTFVGVGFNTRVEDMRQLGLKPFAIGILLEAGVAAITLVMVLIVYGPA